MGIRVIAQTSAAVLLLALWAPLLSADTEENEERARVVKIAAYLESHPIADDAKELRAWAIRWLIDHPELDFTVCTSFLEPLLKSKHPYSSEINLQMILSSGSFVIQKPEQLHDKPAVYEAGLTGSLNVYRAIVREKPEVKDRFLEGLLRKLEKGELPKYIQKRSKSCE